MQPSGENDIGALAASGLLEGLSAESRQRLAAGARAVRLRAGETLFSEGEPADGAFIVRSGRLQVIAADGLIRSVKRGAVVGELALLTGMERSATVRAVRDSDLLEVSRELFEQALADDPGFAQSLCGVLASQLAVNQAPPPLQEPPRTVAIVALDADLSVDDVAGRLTQELERSGGAVVLRAGDAESAGDWHTLIDRAEAANRWVIMTSSAGPADPWSQLCVAEADRVVALSRGRPLPGWLERPELLHGCELLIRGPFAADWLLRAFQPRSVQTLPDAGAVERFPALAARRLNGRSLGIVLSGGGARAFAHLGVVEELRAAGVRIDRVAGVSMGSLVAAAVALEMDDRALYEAMDRGFVAQNPSGDYTLPMHSLVRGRRTRRLLLEAFGDVRIEQLPLRFFCVSVDLNARSLFVHRSGPLGDAVFASLAIPGVFPPIPTAEGRLLVDGGVLDNLPVETMARDAEGPVIAVDVTRVVPWQPRLDNPRTSWRARAASVISGQPHELPRLAETMFRTLVVGSRDTVATARRHADLVITPQVDGAGLLDWKQLPRMRDAGRAAVRELLEADPEALQRYV